MNQTPIAADDSFTASQGAFTTVISGHLGADNGSGVDSDPDGSLLGWAGPGFSPMGDGEDFLGAFFSNGVLGFLSLQHSGYVTFPVWSTALVLTTAQGGRVVLQTNGSFTYTAPAGFSGTDWFDYSLVDAAYDIDIGRVTLHVIDSETGNDRPVARDDHFSATEDVKISGNLLADNGKGSDSDANGDALSVVNRTQYTAKGGLVSIFANGDFIYTPPANFSGTDSFTYTVRDIHGASSTATVTLDLSALNDAPKAVNDSFSGVHGKPITGNVVANDSDADGDPLNVAPQSIVTANGGVLTLLANGSFTYSPAAGFVGIDSFVYSLRDGHGGVSQATVTLDIFNTAPVARSDWFSASFGQTASGNVLANDSDADGDLLGVTAGTFSTAHGGSLTLKADGSFVYVPGDAWFGTDSFQYQVSDGFGGTATGTALINVSAPAGSIYGTNEADTITGTALADFIFAFDEDDVVAGGDGADMIAGGLKEDTLNGDAGADKLYGQGDGDLLRGGLGNDILSGGQGSDDLYGNDGSDRLYGGEGADKLYGGAGNDRFIFQLPGGSADKIMDFRSGDKLCVTAAGFGLAAGSLPDQSYLATAGAPDVGHGRFLYLASTRTLAWDADGNTGTANAILATFDSKVNLDLSDFLVI